MEVQEDIKVEILVVILVVEDILVEIEIAGLVLLREAHQEAEARLIPNNIKPAELAGFLFVEVG